MDARPSSTGARRTAAVAAALVAAALAAGCSSNGSPSGTATAVASSVPAGAVNPNAPEVVEPGDIPDNQVFVPYAPPDGRFSVKVPEGWARTDAPGGGVIFTDKYNSITIAAKPVSATPTVDSVRTDGLADVAKDPAFSLVDVKPVTRSAGSGVLARYEIGSAPNAVTGKQALLAVERYVFVNKGTEVTLTLSGAKGADNVDPWKLVSDSLTWQ